MGCLPTAFCCCATSAFGAGAPQDFAGVRWGSQPAEAKDALAAKGARFKPKRSNEGSLVFGGGNLAGKPVDEWTLDFDNGRLSKALVRFSGKGAEEQYRRLRELLNGKYGSASGAQIGRRKPPHFVLGLGWQNGGTKPPPLHSEWSAESALDHLEVNIHLWVHKGQAHLAYDAQTGSSTKPQTQERGGVRDL